MQYYTLSNSIRKTYLKIPPVVSHTMIACFPSLKPLPHFFNLKIQAWLSQDLHYIYYIMHLLYTYCLLTMLYTYCVSRELTLLARIYETMNSANGRLYSSNKTYK